MRHATLAFALVLVACNDLRDFRGSWDGARVGDDPKLRVGVSATAHAQLEIGAVDKHGIAGTLAIDGLFAPTPITSLEGAEADALASLTFSGAPLRVYLAFVPVPDGGGDALAVIGLYDERRIDLRIMRQGGAPLYAIFTLAEHP